MGIYCSSSGEELAGGKRGFDTVAAQTGWWIFERKSAAKKQEVASQKGKKECSS